MPAKDAGIFRREAPTEPPRQRFRSNKIAQAPFVTISRQAGARGHELAAAILSALESEMPDPTLSGWRSYDREICEKILRDKKLKMDLDSLLSEKYRSAIEDIFHETFSGRPSQAAVNYEIFKAVRALALAGKSVIVGRAAACFTQDLIGGLHLRLVASEKTRLEVLARLDGLATLEQARERARELDYSRAKTAEVYFNRNIEDPLLYHAIWNVDKTPMTEIAEWVVRWIQQETATLAAL